MLRQTGWTFDVPVEGSSMEPLLRKGDRVTVVCGFTRPVDTGDLVCFKRGDGLIVHRLIARGYDHRWYEKGDSEFSGSWIAEHQMIGRITQINGADLADHGRMRAVRIGRLEMRWSWWRSRWHIPCLPAFIKRAFHRWKSRSIGSARG